MGFFRELPNVAYQTPLKDKLTSDEYILTKNLFRSAKVLDWLENNITAFNKFIIEDDDRPDTIAKQLYGDSTLDYIVVITAGITNIRNQWPLSDQHLYEFAKDKYGTELNALHHYETFEVIDEMERTILPPGLNVDQDFKIDGPGTKKSTTGSTPTWQILRPNGSKTATIKNELTVSDIGVGISNYMNEVLINEEKRKIRVLKPGYVQLFLNDFRRVMRYDRNTQYINPKLIGTENTRIIE